MAFLAGAAAAGFLVGRLVRNASQSQNGDGNGSTPQLSGMPYAEPVPALPAEGMTTAPTGAAPARVGHRTGADRCLTSNSGPPSRCSRNAPFPSSSPR